MKSIYIPESHHSQSMSIPGRFWSQSFYCWSGLPMLRLNLNSISLTSLLAKRTAAGHGQVLSYPISQLYIKRKRMHVQKSVLLPSNGVKFAYVILTWCLSIAGFCWDICWGQRKATELQLLIGNTMAVWTSIAKQVFCSSVNDLNEFVGPSLHHHPPKQQPVSKPLVPGCACSLCSACTRMEWPWRGQTVAVGAYLAVIPVAVPL